MNRKRMDLWKRRLSHNDSAYKAEESRMDKREELYLGTDVIEPMTDRARKKSTPHIRNLCAELIESQVDSNIPQPKVTPVRREDEWRAAIIEDMLRNELDRLPFEEINDQMERTVPIQGGGLFLIEWDNTQRTNQTVGEIAVSWMHPKQLVPQDGVYTSIEDMDYVILKIPQTKGYIKSRYGVDVKDEAESEPEVKGRGDTADDMVTQYVAYYRNKKGGIGLYSWVGDTELEDMEDYQARRLRRCKQCGAVEPLEAEPVPDPAVNGLLPGMTPDGTGQAREGTRDGKRGQRTQCPYCGSTEWEDSQEEYEEVYVPIPRSDGTQIPGATLEEVPQGVDALGMSIVSIVEAPTKIPFYKPDNYPVILQKNVSVYGKLLGESDIDKIATQQNTTNRIEAKIIDKLVKSGSYMTLPDAARIKVDEDEMKVIRPGSAADMAMIGVFDLEGNIEQDITYLAQVYEEARQAIGITDSYQGRKDTTATSGTAKEFSAAQAAGRLESKRVMKDAAYARLFEAMFKFKLAYSDEPRPVVHYNNRGEAEYRTFNRYDFLEQDEAGNWYWNDRFIFSCDTSAPLASNREAMWQETRMNLQTGAFGDPTNLQTLILFWSKMEMLHYPGAGETKSYLEEAYQQQQQQHAQMMQMQMQMAQRQQAMQQQAQQAQIVEDTVSRAQQDAQQAAQSGVPAAAQR